MGVCVRNDAQLPSKGVLVFGLMTCFFGRDNWPLEMAANGDFDQGLMGVALA